MKAMCTCALIAGSLLLTACETAVVEHRHRPGVTTTRRYISYSDTDPYYRVYYREPAGRTYYRQYYYDDLPEYRTYRSTRRYYYNAPATRASVRFGF